MLQINWDEYITNMEIQNSVNMSYNTFVNLFNKEYNDCFPLVSQKANKNLKKLIPRSEWITPRLVNLCEIKSRLHRLYKKNATIQNELKYKVIRNKLKGLLKKREKEFYEIKFKKPRATQDITGN